MQYEKLLNEIKCEKCEGTRKKDAEADRVKGEAVAVGTVAETASEAPMEKQKQPHGYVKSSSTGCGNIATCHLLLDPTRERDVTRRNGV